MTTPDLQTFYAYTYADIQQRIDRATERGSAAFQYLMPINNDGGTYWGLWKQHIGDIAAGLREKDIKCHVKGTHLLISLPGNPFEAYLGEDELPNESEVS